MAFASDEDSKEASIILIAKHACVSPFLLMAAGAAIFLILKQ
jgi:hypothetical protein